MSDIDVIDVGLGKFSISPVQEEVGRMLELRELLYDDLAREIIRSLGVPGRLMDGPVFWNQVRRG